MKTFFVTLFLTNAAMGAPTVLVHSRSTYPGDVLLIEIQKISKCEESEIQFQEEKILPFLWHDRCLAFGPIDLSRKPGDVRLRIDSKSDHYHWDSMVKIEPKDFGVRQLKVDDKFSKPSKADEERAERETQTLLALFQKRTGERLFDGNFLVPIQGSAASRFGERSQFNGEWKKPHSGADLEADLGTVVHSSGRGKVALIGDFFYPGKTLVIDHGLGVYTFYMHLSEILVKEGDLVDRGAKIAKVGATGRVTGPHLHWGLRINGAKIDPFSLTALNIEVKS